MSDLDNREKAIELYDCYGLLLTKTQQEFFSSYYLFDLSLSEIAEEKKISRSAVNDALSKALKKLNEYESKLHLLEKNKSIREMLGKIDESDEKTKLELYKELGDYLKYGI